MMDVTRIWDLLAAKVTGWTRDLILLLPNLVVALLVLLAFWLLARLVKAGLSRGLSRVSHSAHVVRLLSQTVSVLVLAAGVFVALGILGLQKTVASLLAGAGIVGLALGLAFQDIASNLLAGIYLSVRHPFRHGHLIKTNDYFGTVQQVRLRWTEMWTQQGQLVLIPNKLIFENPILNYTSLGRRRIDLAVGVSYGEDLAKVQEVTVRAVEEISTRLQERPVELFYEEFGDSSINFVVRFWIPFQKQPDYLKAKSEAIMRIKTAFDAEGITIPFPIRTLDFGAKGGERLAEVLEKVPFPPSAIPRDRE